MIDNIDFKSFYCGSLYVPFDVYMYMQKDSTENLITDIVDNREDDQTEDIRLFKN